MPLTTYTAGEVLTAASLNANLSFAASNPSSAVVQIKSTTLTTTFTAASTSFTDITGLSVSITPTSATNKIFVIVSVSGSNDVGNASGGVRLARGGTGIFVGDTAGSRTSGNMIDARTTDTVLTAGLSFLDSPATTSATTYSVQLISPSTGTFYVNRSELDQNNSGGFRTASSITVMEVTP